MPFNNRRTIIRWDNFTQQKTLKKSKLLSFYYDFNYTLKSSFCYIKMDPNISVVEACPMWIQASCHSNWKYWGCEMAPNWNFMNPSLCVIQVFMHTFGPLSRWSLFSSQGHPPHSQENQSIILLHIIPCLMSLISSHVWFLVPTFVL
jgi:hypothetical protein